MGRMLALIDRHYELANTGRWDEQASLFEKDVVTQMPGTEAMHGVDSHIGYAKAFWAAAPNARLVRDRVIAETTDTIVVEGRFIGTQTGPLVSPAGTLPTTGRHFELPFCDIMMARGDGIAEHHVWYDQAALLGQLGLLPQPAAAG